MKAAEIRNTPWGRAESFNRITDEIYFASSPSHGGYKVIGKSLERINELFPKLETLNGDGWFEEDCEWACVAIAFPELFQADMIAVAKGIIKRYYPEHA